MPKPVKPLKLPEFVILLAMMTSILAFSIDAMLPALGIIGSDLGLKNPNDAQLIVSAMFFGFAVGQIFAGPLSDSFGRKPVIYVGYVLFIAGSLLAMLASRFDVMIAGRVLQGLGSAAPRIVSMALIRDGYEGRAMARITSIIMALFILVPAVAPAIGQGILVLANWRAIFAVILASAVIAAIWFAVRQPETLLQENRQKFSLTAVIKGFGEALKIRALVGYTIAAGLVFGAFIGFLNSARQVFQTTYQTGEYFPVYFAIVSAAIGAASVINARVVVRLGMRFMAWRALILLSLTSIIFSLIAYSYNGIAPFWMFICWLVPTFFCMGILFGNFNALAMEPVGHMAGLGAALVGSFTTLIALPFGWTIGAAFDGTAMPIIIGFALLGILSMLMMWWTDKAPSPPQL